MRPSLALWSPTSYYGAPLALVESQLLLWSPTCLGRAPVVPVACGAPFLSMGVPGFPGQSQLFLWGLSGPYGTPCSLVESPLATMESYLLQWSPSCPCEVLLVTMEPHLSLWSPSCFSELPPVTVGMQLSLWCPTCYYGVPPLPVEPYWCL